MANEVDVVVVGGSTGAVSAALAAAEQGASVFLAAPYPYLGEDMTSTLQLWLEPGEQPTSSLARRIYDDVLLQTADPNRLNFSYTTDVPSAPMHRDSDPPSRLSDGKWSDAPSQSVQYERDTTIVADLTKAQDLRRVQLRIFRRLLTDTAGGGGFDVGQITVSASNDGTTWTSLGKVVNDVPFESLGTLSLPVEHATRYVKVEVTLA